MLTQINRYLMQPALAWKANSQHLDYWRQLEKSQYWAPAAIQEHQLTSLKSMLRHAWLTVPYYRSAWADVGCHPEMIQSLADLAHFPILTKADLRSQGSRLKSEVFAQVPTIKKTTSGSTGISVTIEVDADAQAWKKAATIRSDQWSGWRLGQTVARLWGQSTVERGNLKARVRRRLFDRELFLNTLGITEERMHHFAKLLIARRPGLVFGHAHSLYLFALFVCKHYPGQIRPNGVISAAMILHDWQRRAIETAFGVPVTNRYGCEEVSLIASECAEHEGLHVNAENVYVEIAPRPGITLEQGGMLLVTDLRNRAMPLIRYQIGDVVVPGRPGACPCGRGLPMLAQVIGREADYVLSPRGELISGISLTDHFATEIRGAEQVQLVQNERELLTIRLVPGREFDDRSRQQIGQLVQQLFGPTMHHQVEVVDAIPQEVSGKYRFCISPVANDYIRKLTQ